MTPSSSGGRARASSTCTVLWMIASMAFLLSPQQQGDKGYEHVQQIGMDTDLLKDTKPGKQPGSETERRQHCLLEHGVGHLAMKMGLLREETEVLGLLDPRAQRPAEQPYQHLGERRRCVLHPRCRRGVA